MNALREGVWIGAALCLALALLAAWPAPSRPSPLPSGFDPRWHDGRAELDGYRYSIVRYGHLRKGQAVMIYVTEPWSRSKRVKVEDFSKDPDDLVDVLKLNLVRDFQTGIYDYNTMVSLFTRTEDFSPIELSFSSAEWCGHVYHKVRFLDDRLEETLFSYFEDETGSRRLERPAGGVPEDALFVLLRGLKGDLVEPGGRRTVPLLSGMLESRLRHHPLEWSQADITREQESVPVRVPAGSWKDAILYQVKLENGRTGNFWVEPDRDRRILKWTWTGPGEASETGELAGSLRTAYWKENDPGNETLLRGLGLVPVVP